MRIWFNGRICEEAEARVSPFDRGFLFGDGVYEGIRFFNRVGVGMERHVLRLERSLSITSITGFDARELEPICQALLEDAGLVDAGVYLQVTRGVQMPRNHLPQGELVPTVFGVVLPAPPLEAINEPAARHCITVEDLRWKRCDIKSINLLPNVMAIMEAHEAGALEPILVRDGQVSEGAMTNVFLVQDGVLLTTPIDDEPSILHGVTRSIILDVAQAGEVDQIDHVEVRPITIEELKTADEVMIASSRRLLDSVVRLDDAPIDAGSPGPVARDLLLKMKAHLALACGIALHS